MADEWEQIRQSARLLCYFLWGALGTTPKESSIRSREVESALLILSVSAKCTKNRALNC